MNNEERESVSSITFIEEVKKSDKKNNSYEVFFPEGSILIPLQQDDDETKSSIEAESVSSITFIEEVIKSEKKTTTEKKLAKPMPYSHKIKKAKKKSEFARLSMLAAEGAAIHNDKLVDNLKTKLRKAEKIKEKLWEEANKAQINAYKKEKEIALIEQTNIPFISLTSESSISGMSESSVPYDPAASVHGSDFSVYEPVDRAVSGPSSPEPVDGAASGPSSPEPVDRAASVPSSPISIPSLPRPTTPVEVGATRQQGHDVLSEESWAKNIQRRLLLLTHPTKRLIMTQFLQDALL